ncbi:MAG: CoB--CoM heterodisulfide reductase iron-sulfur subunit B family protein [Planctomycetota bacterium]|jgi:heterodisulfide reductase subunit B
MTKEFAYYPGCWLRDSASEYAASFEAICRKLGITLDELADWTCCGAPSTHAVNPDAAYGLSLANLALARRLGKPLVVPCSICWNNLCAARQAATAGDPAVTRNMLEDTGADTASVEVLNVLEFFSSPEITAALTGEVCQSLSGFRVACYYGCLLTRPPKWTGADDCENPRSMEPIVEMLGAETVDWPSKTFCCGAAVSAAREEIALDLVGRILPAAVEAGANCLAVACPLCHRNLDILQFEVSRKLRRKVEVPVFYLTELIAMAFDLPGAEKWLKKHLTTVFPLVDEVLLGD